MSAYVKEKGMFRNLKPYYVLSAIAAVLILIATLGGLFVKPIYASVIPENLVPPESQVPAAYGQDLIVLVAGLPLLIISMLMTRRGSVHGVIMWLGTLSFIFYAYATYAFVGLMNVFFLLYTTLMGLSVFSMIGILINISDVQCRIKRDKIGIFVSGYLFVTAILFVVLWVLRYIDTLNIVPPYSLTPIILTLDLSFYIPALFLAAIWTWQRKSLGYILSGAFLIKSAALFLSVWAGRVYLIASGFEVTRLFIYATLTIISIVIALIYLPALKKGDAEEVRAGND